MPHEPGSPSQDGPRAFAALLAVDGIDFKPISLDDPVPLGRQIVAAGGFPKAAALSLYAVTASGDFEDVRLDEPFDLRAKGAERFVAFSADRVYRLFVNDREIKWGPDSIGEHALRFLASAADDEAIFLDVPGGTDRLVKENESVDLTGQGVEKFVIAKRPRTYRFFVNGKQYETDQRRLTGLQIKARVADWDPTHDLVLEGHGDEPDRIVADGDTVDLDVEHGVRRFSSVPKANFG